MPFKRLSLQARPVAPAAASALCSLAMVTVPAGCAVAPEEAVGPLRAETVYAVTDRAELIRFNAERGECGPGEVESHVARRLDHMRRGTHHAFQRRRNDGRVIRTVGGPMPGGG
jgi:hypothetical protein